MTKPKMLIAIGDSFTHGWGNYDPDELKIFLSKHKNAPAPDPSEEFAKDFHTLFSKSESRIFEYSWPNLLKIKLGYDKVLNLGRGGSSVAGNVKRFIMDYGEHNFSTDYDVTLIWMIPTATRIGFFINGNVQDILLNSAVTEHSELVKSLLKLMSNPDSDFKLEQSFYIRIMRLICQLYGYKFIFDFTFGARGGLREEYINTPEFLDNTFPTFTAHNRAYDGHFNELGYKQLADNIYNSLINKGFI